MSTESPTAVVDHDRQLCRRLADQLADDFGQSFQVWIFQDGWRVLTDEGEAPSVDREFLDRVLEQGSIQVAPLPDGGAMMGVIHEGDGVDVPSSPLVALSLFPQTSVSELGRLAKLYTQLAAERDAVMQADYAVESMAEQVTSNFEELMLLRGMAEHLQLDGGANDASEVASKLLPALQRTLSCQHLALVQLRPETEQDRIYWSDTELMTDRDCLELIQQVGGDGERPRIDNEFRTHDPEDTFPHIRELALVPIGGSGWLMAVNRDVVEPQGRTIRFEEVQQAHKFGTFEVTLMASAASMLTAHFRNLDLLHEKQAMFTETVKSLINAVDARDPYTRGHSERVGLFSKRFAHHLGLSKAHCERIYLSGLLHDVGKIGVSDATLQKPGKLTDDEYDELKQHPDQGWAILSNLHTMQDILPGVLYHHERWDGKGYPCGLAGEDIPIEGRLMSICDAYDAMTSDRPYRDGMPQEKAEAILRDGKGTQWDPRLVDEFLELMPDIIRIRETYAPRPVKTRNDRV